MSEPDAIDAFDHQHAARETADDAVARAENFSRQRRRAPSAYSERIRPCPAISCVPALCSSPDRRGRCRCLTTAIVDPGVRGNRLIQRRRRRHGTKRAGMRGGVDVLARPETHGGAAKADRPPRTPYGIAAAPRAVARADHRQRRARCSNSSRPLANRIDWRVAAFERAAPERPDAPRSAAAGPPDSFDHAGRHRPAPWWRYPAPRSARARPHRPLMPSDAAGARREQRVDVAQFAPGSLCATRGTAAAGEGKARKWRRRRGRSSSQIFRQGAEASFRRQVSSAPTNSKGTARCLCRQCGGSSRDCARCVAGADVVHPGVHYHPV